MQSGNFETAGHGILPLVPDIIVQMSGIISSNEGEQSNEPNHPCADVATSLQLGSPAIVGARRGSRPRRRASSFLHFCSSASFLPLHMPSTNSHNAPTPNPAYSFLQLPQAISASAMHRRRDAASENSLDNFRRSRISGLDATSQRRERPRLALPLGRLVQCSSRLGEPFLVDTLIRRPNQVVGEYNAAAAHELADALGGGLERAFPAGDHARDQTDGGEAAVHTLVGQHPVRGEVRARLAAPSSAARPATGRRWSRTRA